MLDQSITMYQKMSETLLPKMNTVCLFVGLILGCGFGEYDWEEASCDKVGACGLLFERGIAL